MSFNHPYVFCSVCYATKQSNKLFLTSCSHVVCSLHFQARLSPGIDKICCPVCKTLGAAILEINDTIPDEVKQYFTPFPEQIENAFPASQFQYSSMKNRIDYQQREIEKLIQKNDLLKNLLKEAKVSIQQKEEYKQTIIQLQRELEMYKNSAMTPPSPSVLSYRNIDSSLDHQNFIKNVNTNSSANQNFINQIKDFNNYKRGAINVDHNHPGSSSMPYDVRLPSTARVSRPIAESTSIFDLTASPISDKIMVNNLKSDDSGRIQQSSSGIQLQGFKYDNTGNANIDGKYKNHLSNVTASISRSTNYTNNSRLSTLSGSTEATHNSTEDNYKRKNYIPVDTRSNARSLSLNLQPPISKRWNSKVKLGLNRLATSSSNINTRNINTRRLDSANRDQSPFFKTN